MHDTPSTAETQFPPPPALAGLTILQLVPTLDAGGAESTTIDITRAITAAGGRAVVASAGGRLAGEIAAAGGRLVVLPMASKNPLIMAANVGRLRRLIGRENVDIVHARSRAPAWSALAAARLAGVAYMATYHGLVHLRPRVKVWYNSGLVRGRAVIANSRYTARRIAQAHGTGWEKIHIIPRGCDVAALAAENFTQHDIDAQRAQWRFAPDDFVIMCPARLTRIKGQHVLIAALAQLSSDRRPVLVLVGSAQGRDAYAAELAALVTRHGLEKRVVFAGLVRDMPVAYAAANLVVVASVRPEPFGRTIIEAQAASRPVIASDAGGFRETVVTGAADDGATGWLVPPDDSTALAAALDAALGCAPAVLARLGGNSRAHARRHFTRETMCAKTLTVYRHLAGESGMVRGFAD